MFVFTCLSCAQSVTLKSMAKVLSKSFLLHKMQVNSKTFVVDILIQEISLVFTFVAQSLSGGNSYLQQMLFAFQPFCVIRSLH